MSSNVSHASTENRVTDPTCPAQRKPNPTRIRDNQRRSRARQKEYLHELESKLQNFERLGVTASLEIQAAARNVLEENKRLRRLLQSAGIAYPENQLVDGPSNREQKPSQAEVLEQKLGGYRPRDRPCDRPCGRPCGEKTVGPGIDEKTSPQLPHLQSPSSPRLKPLALPPQCVSTAPNTTAIPAPPPVAEPDPELQPMVTFPEQNNPTNPVTDPPKSSGNTCSCAFAANIIMNMRADLGANDVNKALGCDDPSPGCIVETARVFTTVDQFMG